MVHVAVLERHFLLKWIRRQTFSSASHENPLKASDQNDAMETLPKTKIPGSWYKYL